MAYPALAQDAARISQGEAVWQKAGCSSCHGADARGGEGGEQPAGPNLRRSSLDRDAFIETVSCGRPGTPMPRNLAGAYTEVSCYEMPVGEVPEGTAQGAPLTSDEIELLVDYILSLK
jgi:mono/diheme cytochrome c family protein